MNHISDCTANFGIARWRAWAPGIENDTDWARWLSRERPTDNDVQPDVSHLPALLRRRLDRQGRMALHTAWPCVADLDSVELVFASRHGALRRTMEMLVALVNHEPLSPTLFSLAVHNSVAGLYSIARGDHSAATAMAAGQDTLAMSLLEGAGMIAAGVPSVLVCYADDILPLPYQPFVAKPATRSPFSISLLLTPTMGAPRCYRLGRTTAALSEPPEAALLRFLVENTAEAVIGVDQPWRLERVSSAD